MSSEEDASELPEHADHDPGAEVKVTRRDDGGVRVDFSDGSDSLEVSRREFMRISGVAAASASMTGASCRYPKEHIVPYLDRQEESEPGEATHYSTVCNGCSAQCGVVVETRSGRPIKFEGNDKHPVNEGSLCARGESSYRRLYDPDRAEGPLAIRDDGNHKSISWEKLDQAVRNKLEDLGSGGTVRILTGNRAGSASDALFQEISDNHPDAEHYVWEPLTAEALLRASETSYGTRHAPVYHFEKADMVVSLGSDFLGTWMSPVEFTKKFVKKREIDDEHPKASKLNRFIAFEGAMTTTGANADEHHTVQPSRLAHVALGLAHNVIVNRGYGDLADDQAVQQALQPFDAESVSKATGIDTEVLESYGRELVDHAGHGLIVAGAAASNSTTGLALEAAVNLLNAALGNEGTTVERARRSRQDEGSFSQLRRLTEEMKSGDVDMLIVDGVNPVYAAPPDLGFEKALDQVGTVVSTADRVDETASQADFLAAGSHFLEAWGDSNPIDGVYSLQQPTIQPLYDTRALEESLLHWFGKSGIVPSFEKKYLTEPSRPDDQQVREKTPIKQRGVNVPYDAGPWYRYLRDHWKSELYPETGSALPFGEFWNAVLRNGVWEMDDAGGSEPSFRVGPTLEALPDGPAGSPPADPTSLDTLELHAVPTVGLYDGRTANNGHLQEMPDPVTKITWGSYAALSPRTFVEADLSEGDVLEVTVEAEGETTTREFPAYMQPGMADGVVAVPLGYGRTKAGVVGNDVGENAFSLARVSDGLHAFAGLEASVSETPRQQEVANVQGSSVIDLDQRPLLATATKDAYEADPGAGVGAHEPDEMLWDAHDYGEQGNGNSENRGEMALKWGMSIDMTKCTGCSACITACQEENNVPVVGKQGVVEGREMHWMRLDRYFLLPTPGEDDVIDELRDDLDDDPMMGDDPSIAFVKQYYEKTDGEVPETLANPQAVNQPMLCQHCERAPCETVCPVAATTHSSDGLNQMTYNRCVGTRYCANNCPYKVRRFNWFNYSRDRGDGIMSRITPELEEHGRLNVEEPLPLGLNPDVTVRSRGVMEKCTFCVQRIRRAKWQLREENRDEFREDDVVTACEKACPADAINFGNIHKSSDHEVRKDHESPRTTRALSHLNTSPSVAYLTDVRNTDDLPGAYGHGDEVGGGHGGGHGDSHGGGGSHGDGGSHDGSGSHGSGSHGGDQSGDKHGEGGGSH